MVEIIDISNLSIGEKLIDTENENKEVEILNLTSTSVEIYLLRNEKYFKREVVCSICGINQIIEKSGKFRCSTTMCVGRATNEKRIYSGIDCKNWFLFDDKYFMKRFKKITFTKTIANSSNWATING